MSMPDLDRDEPLEFLRLLWTLDHALQAASKRMLARYGVTGPQRSALRLIGQRPGLAAGALAQALQDHPSTVTGILQRLVARGLVKRQVHPGDRRRAVLTLTEAGRRLDTPATGTVELAVRTAFSRLTPEEIATARRVLDLLVRAIQDESAARGPYDADPGAKG